MTQQTFTKFTEALSAYYAKKRVLAGSEIFEQLSQYKSDFTFIKCDEIKDRVIVFGDKFPFAYNAVLIDDIIAMHEMISSVSFPMYVSLQDENNFTLIGDSNLTMMQINDTEITFKQELK